MDLAALPPGPDPPSVVNVVIEIQQDGGDKYEYAKNPGVFRLDRVHYSAMRCPMGYGFIPGAPADDAFKRRRGGRDDTE